MSCRTLVAEQFLVQYCLIIHEYHGMQATPTFWHRLALVLSTRTDPSCVLRFPCEVLKELLTAGRKTQSMKIARIASAIAAFNPFEKVLEMIRNTITLIEEEEKDDVAKKDWSMH